MLTRRSVGQLGLALLSVSAFSRITHAQPAAGERRFIFIMQRGAADALHMIVPTGDSGLRTARASLVDAVGEPIKLDGFFSAHPALSEIASLYQSGQASFVHAIASVNRDRSHFDAQNILETGGLRPYAEAQGWLNRLAGLVPGGPSRALALSSVLPAAMRGPNPVSSYAPSRLPDASSALLAHVDNLYAHDEQLRSLWQRAIDTRAMAGTPDDHNGRGMAETGALAARLMAPAGGARLLMIETGGWDTHSGQKARMAVGLTGLDRMIGAIRTGLGAAWSQTLVLVATEFGRTVAANGTGGSDHGTAAAAMLLGGAVKGGRIISDWPGLRNTDLLDGRDLKPTLQLEALVSSALAEHYSVDPHRMAKTLYPAQSNLKPLTGLIKG